MAHDRKNHDAFFAAVKAGDLDAAMAAEPRPGCLYALTRIPFGFTSFHPLNSIDQLGFAALHYAAMRGDVKMCEWLVGANASVNKTSLTLTRRTPLQLAVSNGHFYVFKFLLENGGQIYMPMSGYENTLACTLSRIELASQERCIISDLAILETLLDLDVRCLGFRAHDLTRTFRLARRAFPHADIKSVRDIPFDQWMQKEFLHAASIGDLEAIRISIDRKLDLNVTDAKGENALMRLARSNSPDALDAFKLLVRYGVDLEAKNPAGQSIAQLCTNTQIQKFYAAHGFYEKDGLRDFARTSYSRNARPENSFVRSCVRNRMFEPCLFSTIASFQPPPSLPARPW